MTALRIELRRGPGLPLAPILFAAGFFYATTTIDTLTLWSATTAGVVNAVFLIGPIAAGVAALAGGRAPRRRAGTGAKTSSRGPVAAAAVEVTALLLWVLGAYAALIMALFIVTATNATWGSPSLPWVAAGVGALVVHVVVGWAIGRLVPFWFTPPVVAVGAFLNAMWVDVSAGEAWWARLFPYKVWILRPFDEVRVGPMLAQTAWYLGIAVAAFAALAVATRARWRLVGALSAVALAGLTTGLVALGSGSAAFANYGKYVEWTCAGQAPQVCMHPAYANSLPEMQRRAEAVAQRLAGTSYAIARVEQRPRGGGDFRPGAGAVGFGFDAPLPRHFDQAAFEIASDALGVSRHCFGPNHEPRAGLIPIAILVDWAAGKGNQRQLGGGMAIAREWIEGQDPAAVRNWINEHTGQIDACGLTLADYQ